MKNSDPKPHFIKFTAFDGAKTAYHILQPKFMASGKWTAVYTHRYGSDLTQGDTFKEAKQKMEEHLNKIRREWPETKKEFNLIMEKHGLPKDN